MLEKTQEQIMEHWSGEKVLVSIKCFTYNQEKFIEKALDSFLSQVTYFPFEVVVHDDASTDSTPAIIKRYEEKYPKIVKPIYETENQYSNPNVSLNEIIKDYLTGKYIASCEGDDYWIDNNKLQKQIDEMQNNDNIGLCFTDFNVYYENINEMHENVLKCESNKYPSEFSLEDWVLKTGYVGPMTWVYRKDLFESFEPVGHTDFTFEFFAYALSMSKVRCLKEITTGVYRIGHESAVHTSDPYKYYNRAKGIHDVKLKMISKYHLSDDFKEKVENNYYNSAFKLIGINNNTDEIQKAKKYCTSFKSKLYFSLVRFSLIRKLLCYIYKKLH